VEVDGREFNYSPDKDCRPRRSVHESTQLNYACPQSIGRALTLKEASVIILTGGKSSRFGSDKTSTLLGDKTLVAHIIDALQNRFPITIVGPEFEHSLPSLQFTREEPIGGGPVSALEAGLKLVSTEYVGVIAGDMPFGGRVITALLEDVLESDGLVPIDDMGFRQTLCAIYRVAPLRAALNARATLKGMSMKSLISLIDIEEIALSKDLASSLLDIDTLEDLNRARSEGR
jgi:molybdopterin-guanine dinucleotide biosynthesis protein A